jgi:hypothetical protein
MLRAQCPAGEKDSLGVIRRGIFCSISGAPHISSPTSFAGGGFLVSLGVGYLINSEVSLGVNFFTGREENPHGKGLPVPGMFDVGGGEIEVDYCFRNTSPVHPYAGIGVGLFTILDNGTGYNGGGPHGELGIRLEASPYFSFGLAAQYRRLWLHNVVASGPLADYYEPLTDNILALSASMTFYPNIYP